MPRHFGRVVGRSRKLCDASARGNVVGVGEHERARNMGRRRGLARSAPVRDDSARRLAVRRAPLLVAAGFAFVVGCASASPAPGATGVVAAAMALIAAAMAWLSVLVAVRRRAYIALVA